MGRSCVVVCLFGLIGTALAGTYPGFSFETSETRNYAPPSGYYPTRQQKLPVSPHQETGVSTISRPIIRALRGAPHYHYDHHDDHHHDSHHHHHVSPTIYLSKSPLYYPEATVFSDPLPIVPLPQLPAEFLTLKGSGAYGGSEQEVPKKKSSTSSRRGRKGKKSKKVEDDEQQETEGDSDGAVGGYSAGPASKQRPRSRQREADEEGDDATAGVSGGYPSSGSAAPAPSPASGGSHGRSRTRQREQEPDDEEDNEDDANAAEEDKVESDDVVGGEGEVTGGYPSSFNANAAASGKKSRSKGNKGRFNEEDSRLETEGEDEDQDEIMMTGEDEDDLDNAAEDEEEEKPRKSTRNRGRSGSRRGKKGQSTDDDDDDDSSALSKSLGDNGQKIDTIFVPTFGNNVLNTVYPAFSQNTLLKSLNAQNNGYPESGVDISSISITSDDEGRKKSKKTSPRRRNRPGSRGRSGKRGGSRKQSAKEPSSLMGAPGTAPAPQNQYGAPAASQGPQNQYGAPPAQLSQQQQYGTPQEASQQYGAPFQSGINPTAQSGGYRTVNNELRQRTSDIPQRFQQPQQQYGALSDGSRSIEPRQLSQAFSSDSSGVSSAVTQDLIRTVQAILEKYPN